MALCRAMKRYVANHIPYMTCNNNDGQLETNNASSLSASPLNSPSLAGQLPPPFIFQESRNFGSVPTSRSTSTLTPHSKASTPSTHQTFILQKTQGKCSHQEGFVDENWARAKILATLAAEKHTRKMAEHAQWMAELEIKKQHMDLEVNDKWLQAEDHRIAAQHQQEHEKEAHDLQMFHLCLQCGWNNEMFTASDDWWRTGDRQDIR